MWHTVRERKREWERAIVFWISSCLCWAAGMYLHRQLGWQKNWANLAQMTEIRKRWVECARMSKNVKLGVLTKVTKNSVLSLLSLFKNVVTMLWSLLHVLVETGFCTSMYIVCKNTFYLSGCQDHVPSTLSRKSFQNLI
jgi:hypothetical protein